MIDQQWPDVVENTHHVWIPITINVRQESYFVYVPITKCASTYLRNAMSGIEFDSRNWRFCHSSDRPLPEPEWTQWFVVLRDPWSRWLSGATHWLSHANYWENLVDYAIDRIELDAHTCPQNQFLTAVDRARTSFMRYCDDIGSHRWFRLQGWKLPTVEQIYHNITVRTDIRQALQDRVTRAQIYRIKDYYHEDYELIRTARFV